MSIHQAIKPALNNVSHASFLALASFQLLEPPGGDPAGEITLLSSRSIIVISLFMLWLVLPMLVELWHRDDRKEVTTNLYDAKSGVTESQSFKGYDQEAIIKLFRETTRRHEANRDIEKTQEGPKQDDGG